jgi:hypothetical protein
LSKPRPNENIRPPGSELNELVQLTQLCNEAVRLHGTDWARISNHIQGSLAALPERDRERLNVVIRAIFPVGPFGGGGRTH